MTSSGLTTAEARRPRPSWTGWAAGRVGLVAWVALLVAAGLTFLPLVPFALAAATRVAVADARLHGSRLGADALAGLREDALAFLAVCAAAGISAALLLETSRSLGELAPALLVPALALAGIVSTAWVVASATTTSPRRVPAAALAVALRHPSRCAAAGSIVLLAGAIALALGAIAWACVVLAVALLGTVRVTWPAVAEAVAR